MYLQGISNSEPCSIASASALSAFRVLHDIPTSVAHDVSVAPHGWAEPILGVALPPLSLFLLVAPHLLLGFWIDAPAMSDDVGDWAIFLL